MKIFKVSIKNLEHCPYFEVGILSKISDHHLTYSENVRISSEDDQKIAEDHPKISEDFQTLPEGFANPFGKSQILEALVCNRLAKHHLVNHSPRQVYLFQVNNVM